MHPPAGGADDLAVCAGEIRYRRTTSDFTGCNADDIQISDVNTSGPHSWEAIRRNDASILKRSNQTCDVARFQ